MPTITELTNYTTADSSDVLPIVDLSTNTTKKITVSNLKSSIGFSILDNYSITLSGLDGTTVTHNKGTTNYTVHVTPTTLDTLGIIGDITVVKASNTCVIYNTGISGLSADVKLFSKT